MCSPRDLSIFLILLSCWTSVAACGNNGEIAQVPATPADRYTEQRAKLVRDGIEALGVTDPQVLRAMRTVPRHRFVPEALRARAYENRPLPIGEGQTISQPYIVALMTDALQLKGTEKVLEIGTGSGYQAAVLAEIVPEVYTIEILEGLGVRAAATLKTLGYDRVHVRIGDGYLGWPEQAPFDAILVTAAPEKVPQPLFDQLARGGRMVIPVGPQGRFGQDLLRYTKAPMGLLKEKLEDVRFVPMTGQAAEE